MRRLKRKLALVYWQFPLGKSPSLAIDDPDIANSLPLTWPPRAEDGRSASFLTGIAAYFKTLFSAEDIVEDAKNTAREAAKRQQALQQTIENAD